VLGVAALVSAHGFAGMILLRRMLVPVLFAVAAWSALNRSSRGSA
jgi:hypothetical protein